MELFDAEMPTLTTTKTLGVAIGAYLVQIYRLGIERTVPFASRTFFRRNVTTLLRNVKGLFAFGLASISITTSKAAALHFNETINL